MSKGDESNFDYTYVPEHLKERVKNRKNLSMKERSSSVGSLSFSSSGRTTTADSTPVSALRRVASSHPTDPAPVRSRVCCELNRPLR